MTCKNAKTILFAGLIAAMILPFSGMNFAEAKPATIEKYTPEDIRNAMQKAGFYITQEDHIIIFDSKTAKQSMSTHEIKIIQDFVKMQNNYVEKVKNNPDKRHSFDSEIEAKFSELKKQIKESKVKNIDFTQWILPEAFAWSDVCGGSFDNPHDEYAKKTTATYTSESTAATEALNLGYHQVSVYATNPLEYFETVDMGKFTTEYGCDYGVFRDQIVI